jgi:glycosyltransferase involved in cell wall biosynthesis
MIRILAFTIKPCESPDSRYRILQYGPIAGRDGVRIDHFSLLGSAYYRWQLRNVQLALRVLLYPVVLLVRLWQVLFVAPKYHAVWISREMAPFGPPILERLLLSRCKRVILDVDDALHIWDKKTSRLIPRLLRDRTKFGRMAARYTAVVCGNRYLEKYYRHRGANVFVIPTVVDTSRYSTIDPASSEMVRIGWIGTPLNRHHLEALRDAFTRLARERRFELVVVGLNEPLDWDFPCIRHLDWSLREELSYFSQFDIGIMPLEDSPFARGKCAFKLIQYMAAGLPVVASPVGANCEVVTHGRNGFLAASDEDWQSMLKLLIDDPNLRRRMGEDGRELVRRSYSADGAWPRYAEILTGVAREEAVCVV